MPQTARRARALTHQLTLLEGAMSDVSEASTKLVHAARILDALEARTKRDMNEIKTAVHEANAHQARGYRRVELAVTPPPYSGPDRRRSERRAAA